MEPYDMPYGRIGGSLIVGGWAALLATAGGAVVGETVAVGGSGAASLLGHAAVALLAAGAAILAFRGPGPLGTASVRLGQGILALGLASALASSIWAGAYPSDPLESWPIVMLFLVGALFILLGAIVTVAGLLRTPGRPRTLGSLFVTGVAIVLLAAAVANAALGQARSGADDQLLTMFGIAASLAGFGAIALAGIGVGILAFDADRPAATAPV
jgi:hypothetical protein